MLAACAHQPPRPARARTGVPPARRLRRAAPPPVSPATGAPPSLAMPREWQHHNGEDYDDLFDRMRAGFALR